MKLWTSFTWWTLRAAAFACELGIAMPAWAALQNNAYPTSGPELSCSGRPYIDVLCYPGADPTGAGDSTSAINSAVSDAIGNGGVPIHFPQGTFKVTSKITLDYAGIAAAGIEIISDGATIDGRTITSGNVLQFQCSGGTTASPVTCSNLRVQGTFTVQGNTPAYVAVIGKTDFSDIHAGVRLDHLIVTNANTSTSAGGLQANYVSGRDLWVSGTTAGGSASVGGIALEQVQNSRIAGFASAAGPSAAGLLIENGTTTGNMVAGFTIAAATNTCVSITSPNAIGNSFITLTLPCITAVNAPPSSSATNSNLFIGPSFAGTNPGPLSSGIGIIGRGSINRFSAPAVASRTLAGSDDGMLFSSANATGPATQFTAASVSLTLPNPAQVGAGWAAGFVSDANKAISLNAPSGKIVVGNRQFTALTIGASGSGTNSYETAILQSDGTNFRITHLSQGAALLNGIETGYPARWYFPGGPGYQVTVGDNAGMISSGATSSGLTATLPTTTAIPSGWMVGFSADANQPLSANVNSISGGNIIGLGGTIVTSLTVPLGSALRLQFDGTNFRLTEHTAGATHVPNNAALAALSGGFNTTIIRDGFYAAGDGGDRSFSFSATPCLLHLGAGDGGTQVPAAGGGCWRAASQERQNVRKFGAKGDASTDDTAAIQAAVNSLPATTGGTIFFPTGDYCVKTGPITVSAPAVTLDGQNSGGGTGSTPVNSGSLAAATVETCGANVSVITFTGRHDTISHLRVVGADLVGTVNPAVNLASGCYECRIDDSYVTRGSYAVSALGAYEIWLIGNSFDTSYGNAILYLGTAPGAVGGYILNNKMDPPYPAGNPALGTAGPAAWVGSHVYASGDLATDAGYTIQAMGGGTSGSALPALLPYGQNMVDGGVTWRLVHRSNYYGIQCDTGCGWDLLVDANDFSGDFNDAFITTNTLAAAGTTTPGGITISHNTFGSNLFTSVALGYGNWITIDHNNFGACLETTCSAISAISPFLGDLNISGNQIFGQPLGMTGIFIGPGVYRTVITGNNTGNLTTAVSIGAGTQDFTIVGNEFGGSALYGCNTNGIIVINGASDNYTIVGNDTSCATATPLGDFGTGVHKLVIDGNAGYAKINHLMGTGPQPTIGGGMGNGATITGSDGAMRINTGTSPSGTPTVNFGMAWPNAPVCMADNESSASAPLQATTNGSILTLFPTANLPASGHVSILCMGY